MNRRDKKRLLLESQWLWFLVLAYGMRRLCCVNLRRLRWGCECSGYYCPIAEFEIPRILGNWRLEVSKGLWIFGGEFGKILDQHPWLNYVNVVKATRVFEESVACHEIVKAGLLFKLSYSGRLVLYC